MGEIKKLKQDLQGISLLWFLSQPGCWAVMNFRIAAACWRSRHIHFLYYLYAPVWRIIGLLTGVEISARTQIDAGFKVVHFGQVFINSHVVIGRNCRIFNGVTIGIKKYGDITAPRIGNDVEIGAGAKIIGDVVIGDGSNIGANAVVTASFPPKSIIVGVPARAINKSKDML